MKIKSWNRIIWAKIYFGIGVIIIIPQVIFHQKVFCIESAMTGWNYFYRFLWCISFASFGFAAIAYYWHFKNNRSPTWPKYVTQYPLQILIIACLVLGLLHSWERTSGYTYYYFSSSICFVFGFFIDYHWYLVKYLLNKSKIT